MTDTIEKSCGCNFNYCLVAKLIVAIPALPASAYIASLLFTDPIMKVVAAVATVLFLVWAAIKVDRMPLFKKKIVK